jgi:hypothetical protein
MDSTLSPAARTLLEMPSPFEARLFGLEDLPRLEVDCGLEDLPRLEVDRVREEPETFFADLWLVLDAERELALVLGLAVLGKGSFW